MVSVLDRKLLREVRQSGPLLLAITSIMARTMKSIAFQLTSFVIRIARKGSRRTNAAIPHPAIRHRLPRR